MAVTQVGIVYYAKDPQRRVFRVVYPTHHDNELDGLPTDGHGRHMRDDAGKPHRWHSFGVKPQYQPTFQKINADDLKSCVRGSLIDIEADLAQAE